MQALQASSVPSLKINYFRTHGTDVLMPAGNIQHSLVAWSERLATAAADEGSSEADIEKFSAALRHIGNSWSDCDLSQILPETNDVPAKFLVADEVIGDNPDPSVLRSLMTTIRKKATEMATFANQLETEPDHEKRMALASVISIISTALLNESNGRLQGIVDRFRDNVTNLKAASSTTQGAESDAISKLRDSALALHIQGKDLTVCGLELGLAQTRVDLNNTLMKSHEFPWTDVCGITSDVTTSTEEAQVANSSKREASFDDAYNQLSGGKQILRSDCEALGLPYDKLRRLSPSTLTDPSAFRQAVLGIQQSTAGSANQNPIDEQGASRQARTLSASVCAPESDRSRFVINVANSRSARRSRGTAPPLRIDGVSLVPESQGTQDD